MVPLYDDATVDYDDSGILYGGIAPEAVEVRYRVQVHAFGASFSIGSLIVDIDNPKNVGYADYMNGVPEAFFTLNQEDSMSAGHGLEKDRWLRANGGASILTPTVAWEGDAVQEPSILVENGVWKMWYRGGGWPAETTLAVGYATSPDGITWTKYGSDPVYGGGGSSMAGNDGGQPEVLKVGSTYYLYATNNDIPRVNVATSTDGIAWTTQTSSITLPSGGTLWGNRVVWKEGAAWKMLQEAMAASLWQIYLYTSSDGLAWSIGNSGNPLSTLQVFAGGMYGGPNLRVIGDLYHVWYHATPNAGNLPTNIYHATSNDLITWTQTGLVLEHLGSGFEFDQVADPDIVEVAGTSYLFYDGDDNVPPESASIGLATFGGTVSQLIGDDPLPLSFYLNRAHVRILRNDRVVWAGWLMDSDENQRDVVFYAYGYAAGLFWTLSEWNQEFLSSEIGTIARTLWVGGKAQSNGGLGFVATGTIESPATADSGGARLTLPLYNVFYKRLLFIFQEFAALAQSDTSNTTIFEITHAESPAFNFWANRGVDLPDVVWEFGGKVNGFHRLRAGVNHRNDLYAVGAAPHSTLLRKNTSDAIDIAAYFRRQEAIFLSWVRDETELDRVNKRRLAVAVQEDTTLSLRLKPNSVVPPGGLSSQFRIGDAPRVVIDRGATQIDAYMRLTGFQVTFAGGTEQVFPQLQDKA